MHTLIKPKRFIPPTIIVSDQALNRKEQRIHDTTASSWGNPARTLERKIEHLARVLNCTEEEATHLFLHNL